MVIGSAYTFFYHYFCFYHSERWHRLTVSLFLCSHEGHRAWLTGSKVCSLKTLAEQSLLLQYHSELQGLQMAYNTTTNVLVLVEYRHIRL